MSVTTALDRIERWAERNDSKFVVLLQPGLTRPDIQALVGGLPFALAEEVYELYQWHDGQKFGGFRFGICSTPMYPFMPLAEALDEYVKFQAERFRHEMDEGWCQFPDSRGWLPLFGMEQYYKASLGTLAGQATSSLIGLTKGSSAHFLYTSLTYLLEFQADLYESGAMRHDEETGDDFADYLLNSQLKRQYFPDAVSQAEAEYVQLGQSDSLWAREKYYTRAFQQHDVTCKLVRAGSQQALPAVEKFLLTQFGDPELAKQVTTKMVRFPHRVASDWQDDRFMLVRNLAYSFM